MIFIILFIVIMLVTIIKFIFIFFNIRNDNDWISISLITLRIKHQSFNFRFHIILYLSFTWLIRSTSSSWSSWIPILKTLSHYFRKILLSLSSLPFVQRHVPIFIHSVEIFFNLWLDSSSFWRIGVVLASIVWFLIVTLISFWLSMFFPSCNPKNPVHHDLAISKNQY